MVFKILIKSRQENIALVFIINLFELINSLLNVITRCGNCYF